MKAATLHTLDRPLNVAEVPEPQIGTGEVIVDVAAAPVLSYADEVFSGARQYPIELPMIPGCGAIGRVRETGPDATRLKTGDWVFCDPTVRSRDDHYAPDIALQGWSARGDGGLRLQRYHHDGPFAERLRLPTENAIPIGPIEAVDAPRWCALNTLLIPYGGWLAIDLAPGETALVSGATGHFGSAAVAVALAMGARCVVAPGRNTDILDDLAHRFGHRVAPVALAGDPEADTQAMISAAPAPIDCVMDILPPSADAGVAASAVRSVRRGGRAVLMGGVGMLGGRELALPYPWIMRNDITIRGQWMYPPEATERLVGLVRAGLLDLAEYEISVFELAQINQAVAHAAEHGGAFRLTAIRP